MQTLQVLVGAAAAGLVLLLLLLGAPGAAAAYGTEISSSVGLFRDVDLMGTEVIKGKSLTRCAHMVDRAGSGGSSKINFLPTHYFVDKNKDNVPDYYCYKPSGKDCLPFTQAAIDNWGRLLTDCLQHAVSQGYHIALTPHMDDGGNTNVWRNAQRINPLQKYGGFSYYDVMLKPISDALNRVITPRTKVWFAMQGEMSAMVFRFPTEHRRIIPALKREVVGTRTDLAAGNIRVGVSTNSNKLCGDYCNKAELANNTYDKAAVQKLFDSLDFIGISAYPKYKTQLAEMEETTQTFDQELRQFGVSLEKLILNDRKELILSEFGTGGGRSDDGNVSSRTRAEASSTPYFGVFGPYTRKLDPWRTYLPETVISGTRQYAREWYSAAALWLKRKGGPTFRVDHAFLWNLNSWDLQGVALESTTVEGSYRDEAIVTTIRDHNLQIQGLAGALSPGSLAPY